MASECKQNEISLQMQNVMNNWQVDQKNSPKHSHIIYHLKGLSSLIISLLNDHDLKITQKKYFTFSEVL